MKKPEFQNTKRVNQRAFIKTNGREKFSAIFIIKQG